jgi:uridylate kinase
MKYNRVLLKLSGEVLAGNQKFGVENQAIEYFTDEIKNVVDQNVELGIVIGGGNIFRGAELIKEGFIDRIRGDYMGMLATVINGIALQGTLEKKGVKAKLITAFEVQKVGEPYNQEKVIQYLNEGFIVIFTGGTSNPLFTTDSGAALRAIEINADVLLKGTKVDGVYSDDPMKNPEAIRYDEVSFKEVLDKELKVMDLTAFALCKENDMPIMVFDVGKKGNLLKAVQNKNIGTIVK